MIGTLDDMPLLVVTVDGVKYFLNLDTKEVLIDKVGLPVITDETLRKRVLKAADEIK